MRAQSGVSFVFALHQFSNFASEVLSSLATFDALKFDCCSSKSSLMRPLLISLILITRSVLIYEVEMVGVVDYNNAIGRMGLVFD